MSNPKPARLRRRLLISAAVLVALVALAPLAVRLPPVRGMLADAIGERVGRRVEIDAASAYWFTGIDLEGITIHSPDGFDGPLATVAKVHVDLDVLGAIGGQIDAAVRVVAPRLTFRRSATGAGNADGVAEKLAGDDEPSDTTDRAKPKLRLTVIGGRIASHGQGGVTEAALSDMDIGLTIADGSTFVELRCTAEDAAAGGGNARVVASATQRADGSLPFELDVPAIDLAKLDPLVRAATPLAKIAGTVQVQGKGERAADGTFAGTFDSAVAGLRVHSADGVIVGIERLQAKAVLASVAGATNIESDITLADLRVLDPRVGESPYHEPSVVLSARGSYHPEGWIRVEQGKLEAGRTAQITLQDTLKAQLEPEVRVQGKVTARADLARVGALRALFPALDMLGGGAVTLDLDGSGDRALALDTRLGVTSLALHPSEHLPSGYTERQINARLRVEQSAEGGWTLRIEQFESALLALALREGAQALSLGKDEAGRFWLDGSFDAVLDLRAASALLATRLPLEAGERLGGTLRIGGTGRGDVEAMQVDATLALRGVTFPPSWASLSTPADLDATLSVRNERKSTLAQVSNLKGMGLSGTVELRLRRDEGGTTLEQVDSQVGVDLARARPWVGALAGLDAGAQLAGMLQARVKLAPEGAGQRLDAIAQVDQLVFQQKPGAPTANEKRLSVRANAWLAPEGEVHRFEELKVTATGLVLDASGATYRAAPANELDGMLRLEGDAAVLAPTLAAFLGTGYEDLKGTGRLGGRVTARGPLGSHLAGLLLDGELVLGSWQTSGLSAQDLKATVARATRAEPITLGVVTVLNRGRVFAQSIVTPGTPAYPWSAQADMAGVDTSGVLTNRGLGRLLSFALPALLPSGGSVAVLSGLLDARVEAASPSVDDPVLMDGLPGTGRLTMAQGQIKDSTLFGSAGGGGLGQVIQGLKIAVPEAGRVLESATKSLTFSSLESEFRFANRVVHVDRTQLTGPTLSVDMKGTVTFDQRTELASGLTLHGSGGEKLGRVLKDGRIPMRVTGTLAAPQVRPDVDMAALLAGAAGGDVKDLLDGLKKDLPKIKNPFK
ncbi:MAG: hypothetical protein O2894_09010 [Planctomycetota bacterium]|nr:hypothetical protein [Planctomycetota bacterium]